MNEKEEKEKKEKITLGKFLLQKRLEKGLSLEKISQDTKILISYLKSIEEDNFNILPPPAYLKGIVKKYTQYLKINPEEALNLLKESNHRQWRSGKNDLLPENRFKIPEAKIIVFLREFIFRFLKYLILFLIIFYLLYELSLILFPPKIILYEPKEDFTTDNAELNISGKVIRAKYVYLKGQPLTLDSEGNFQYSLILSPGLNQIEIKATNHLGRFSTIKININYTPKK